MPLNTRKSYSHLCILEACSSLSKLNVVSGSRNSTAYQVSSLKALIVAGWRVHDPPNPARNNSDFLGRATIPTVLLLHPPPGGMEAPLTIPLVPLEGPSKAYDAKNNMDNKALVNSSDDGGEAEGGDGTLPQLPSAAPRTASRNRPGGDFANRMMQNVQKHLHLDETITGTVTISLELFEFGDDEERLAIGTGVREPGAPPAPAGYAAAKFKVAEDAAEARLRREREGIRVPGMLSRVQALHDRLKGDAVVWLEVIFSTETRGHV